MATRDQIAFESLGGVVNRFAIRKSNAFLLALWNDLVDLTPVDTGAARSNWYITPGHKARKRNPRDGTKYARPVEPEIAHYTDRWRHWYVTNTSTYAALLNEGSSQQQPEGWVDEAVQRNLLKFSNKITRPR